MMEPITSVLVRTSSLFVELYLTEIIRVLRVQCSEPQEKLPRVVMVSNKYKKEEEIVKLYQCRDEEHGTFRYRHGHGQYGSYSSFK